MEHSGQEAHHLPVGSTLLGVVYSNVLQMSTLLLFDHAPVPDLSFSKDNLLDKDSEILGCF